MAAPANDTGNKSLSARLAASLMPPLNRVVISYQREEAEMRLLACHSAILRYQWEHEQLPASLAALNLGALTVDPYTGQPLHYAVKGRTYLLTGAGPVAAADDSLAVNGRRPISVVPAE